MNIPVEIFLAFIAALTGAIGFLVKRHFAKKDKRKDDAVQLETSLQSNRKEIDMALLTTQDKLFGVLMARIQQLEVSRDDLILGQIRLMKENEACKAESQQLKLEIEGLKLTQKDNLKRIAELENKI